MFKINFKPEEFLAHPAMTAVFVIDFFILAFGRLPGLVNVILLGVLVYISMFFGSRLVIPEDNQPSSPEETAQAK